MNPAPPPVRLGVAFAPLASSTEVLMRHASALVIGLLAAAPAFAATWHVNPEGTGDFPDIQSAVAGAADGDEILLDDGVFSGSGNTNVSFLGKAITIRSASGNASTCSIDPRFSARAFLFNTVVRRAGSHVRELPYSVRPRPSVDPVPLNSTGRLPKRSQSSRSVHAYPSLAVGERTGFQDAARDHRRSPIEVETAPVLEDGILQPRRSPRGPKGRDSCAPERPGS
jgi:hypothetical protein